MSPNRRLLLLAGATLAVRPALATPQALERAVATFTGGAPLRDGRVQLDIAPLVENGNTVPVTLSVPGSEGVRRLALFTERNPQPEVAVFTLGPLAGRAQVATRMRLATSQAVIALAELADGSFWQQRVQVVVTLAACVEGG
jgi:sulfur-oxidizing protein SoxY